MDRIISRVVSHVEASLLESDPGNKQLLCSKISGRVNAVKENKAELGRRLLV